MSKGKRTVAPLTGNAEKRNETTDLAPKPLEVKVIKHSDADTPAANIQSIQSATAKQQQSQPVPTTLAPAAPKAQNSQPAPHHSSKTKREAAQQVNNENIVMTPNS